MDYKLNTLRMYNESFNFTFYHLPRATLDTNNFVLNSA